MCISHSTYVSDNSINKDDVARVALRSRDPSVWHHRDGLAPYQTEHRLEVPHGVASQAARPAADGEGVPRQGAPYLHTRATADGEPDARTDARPGLDE